MQGRLSISFLHSIELVDTTRESCRRPSALSLDQERVYFSFFLDLIRLDQSDKNFLPVLPHLSPPYPSNAVVHWLSGIV